MNQTFDVEKLHPQKEVGWWDVLSLRVICMFFRGEKILLEGTTAQILIKWKN